MSVRELSMAEGINEAIRHEMRRDPNIVLLGQDIGSYGGTFGVYKGLFDEFGPDRVHDGPLCEAAIQISSCSVRTLAATAERSESTKGCSMSSVQTASM